MAHFQFEQQLSEAMRMDTSLHVTGGPPLRQSLKPTSRLNVSSAGLNRSRSASRLSTTAQTIELPKTSRSKSPARRSKTPTRCGIDSALNNAKRKSLGPDRFIPNRSTTDMEFAQHSVINTDDDNTDSLTAADFERKRVMEETLNSGYQTDARILSFKSKAPAVKEGHLNNMKILYSTDKPAGPKAANTRQIPSEPEKILDAPDMLNDFYLHLMDWSSQNHMAVALSAGVYVWNAADGSIVQLCQKEREEEYVTSVSWIKEGSVLAIGDSEGAVQLWDVGKSRLMRTMSGHSDRVATLAWHEHLLASGGREGEIHLHDVRVPDHRVAVLAGHSQEVCGLAWTRDGRMLASGGNDNNVQIWDTAANSELPLHTITAHQSAVKAISWCPWQSGVLATGGGTVDRTIRMWSAATFEQLSCLDTGSQICSIVWNSDYKELVSGHGFSHNQLTVWKYPTMRKVADLRGHTSRLLLLTTSPDGSKVASVAADETIMLWNIWPTVRKEKSTKERHAVSKLALSIR